MKLVILLQLIFITQSSLSQNIYYKKIDVSKSNDSLIAELKVNKCTVISYHKSCYWWSERDTTDEPNIRNSYFNFYRDTNNRNFVIVVNPYSISEPIPFSADCLSFIKYNWRSIYTSKLRPDKRDCYIDSEMLVLTLKKHPSMDSLTAIKWSMDCPIANQVSDGISVSIDIIIEDSSYKVSFDETVFSPSDSWYEFNSSMLLYTFKQILDIDRERVFKEIQEKIRNQFSKLEEVERDDYINRQISLRIQELRKERRSLRKVNQNNLE